MAAAILADTQNLLRLIVPRSLLLQTAQVLQARIGGLVGREVCHLPFSRKTPTNAETVNRYFEIHARIRASSGVMVALPEHLMSFKLSGLQRLSDSRMPEAIQLIKTEQQLRDWVRDILDESDYTLAVRTQLIYPSGAQSTVDGHPFRWETAEALLQLFQGHLWNLKRQYPQSIDVVQRPQGRFTMAYFLGDDVENALLELMVRDILHGRTRIFSSKGYNPTQMKAIKHFISQERVSKKVMESVDNMFREVPNVKAVIYLLRGLFVHRILLLTLKKCWNVQYGLDPRRDPMAVPYHAKGVPTEQAEWGHPDVAILFTCLSFYYGGLSIAQLRQNLEHLVKSDDPSSEYGRWTQTTINLPSPLCYWDAINVNDEIQLNQIWSYMRYNIIVVDYFLNHFVFPRHAKQFKVKLQTSGWDIPLPQVTNHCQTVEAVQTKTIPSITGFSGTNDNKALLPLTVSQQDLPGLRHTNAEVLTYLLQPRSRRYVKAADWDGKRVSEYGLLKILQNYKIRMLIDAGAQVLEMDNFSLVKTWLKVDIEARAALYFDNEDKPYVLYRNGTRVPLVASPFADNLEGCLVYLDEAHTRGTDLKMPTNATGALTLGLGQTKDHTVQGKVDFLLLFSPRRPSVV